jgi:hypothetical protein
VTKLVLCGLRRQIAKNTSSTGNYGISSGPVSRLDRAVLSNRVAVSLSVTNLRGRSSLINFGYSGAIAAWIFDFWETLAHLASFFVLEAET